MHKARLSFCVFLLLVAATAIVIARQWTFQAALFPLSVSLPLLILAAIELLLSIFGRSENNVGAAVDLEFTSGVPPEIERRRVISAFSWIAAFVLSVYLIGFPITVPLFIFAYLRFESGVGLLAGVLATAFTWALFFALFQKLVHLQFEQGALQAWLGL
jgi:hypothetical protein